MKLKFVPVFCIVSFLLVFAPLAKNQESVYRRDGNWWLDESENSKLKYVVGFFDGMDLGGQFASWGWNDKDQVMAIKIHDSYNSMRDKYIANVTNGQLVEGLDKFYADFRNRRIQTKYAFWIVVNQISGKSDSEMQTMIENWRKSAAQN